MRRRGEERRGAEDSRAEPGGLAPLRARPSVRPSPVPESPRLRSRRVARVARSCPGPGSAGSSLPQLVLVGRPWGSPGAGPGLAWT